MPTHISTMEAVVTVIEGEAVIEMAGKDHALRASDTLVIPAGEPHSLVMKAKTTS
jgi:quercetin dioxygenase-like cupin family protein